VLNVRRSLAITRILFGGFGSRSVISRFGCRCAVVGGHVSRAIFRPTFLE
jgi:hypothetical protein